MKDPHASISDSSKQNIFSSPTQNFGICRLIDKTKDRRAFRSEVTVAGFIFKAYWWVVCRSGSFGSTFLLTCKPEPSFWFDSRVSGHPWIHVRKYETFVCARRPCRQSLVQSQNTLLKIKFRRKSEFVRSEDGPGTWSPLPFSYS